MHSAEEIRRMVRAYYSGRADQSCCGGTCCHPAAESALETRSCCESAAVAVEEAVGSSLGCGIPVEYADLRAGETVVDLGSGAGGDVIRAAQRVGPRGRAIGVDMTAEMIWRARENARPLGIANAEFRLGEIEQLPLPDGAADVVISNCVINLVPDKLRAFREAFRVLKPGGRLVISDMVSRGPLPEEIRRNPDAWAACIAGASDLDEYLNMLRAAGFSQVELLAAGDASPGQVFSATVRAIKPGIQPQVIAGSGSSSK